MAYHGLKVPMLRRRLNRLAAITSPASVTVVRPLLSPQAAAVPTDQSLLK